MTKSQNTKNDTLTEQWKKGELPEGWYYCKIGNNNYILSTWKGVKNYIQLKNKDGEVFIREMDDCKVLAEVPDYVEWQNMVNCACEEHEANKRFIEENAQLKEQINHLLKTQARQFVDNQKLQVKAEKAKDVVNIDTARQIKQLKELLKECKTPLKVYNEMFGNKEELLDKIDEVLK